VGLKEKSKAQKAGEILLALFSVKSKNQKKTTEAKEAGKESIIAKRDKEDE